MTHTIGRIERRRISRDGGDRRVVCACGSATAWHRTTAAALTEFRTHAGIPEPAGARRG